MAMASTSLGNIVDDDQLALSCSGIFPESRPSNCKPLPNEIFKTDEVEGPIPTNDWWSSLAWTEHSADVCPSVGAAGHTAGFECDLSRAIHRGE